MEGSRILDPRSIGQRCGALKQNEYNKKTYLSLWNIELIKLFND